MSRGIRYAGAVLGAGVLLGSALTEAWASRPVHFGDLSLNATKHTTLNGTLTVTDVLRAQKNASVYGHFYAHNAAQVWSSLLVHTGGITVASGGVKSDALDVTGAAQVGSANVTGNLQAGTLQSTGTITGGSLTLGTGGATIAGKVTSNGLDAGAGGLSTTGALNAATITSTGGITGASITTNGDITTNGKLTAANATLAGLSVTGPVNFNNVAVTGLNLSNINLSTASLQSEVLGSPTATTPPLSLSQNGQTTQLGVDNAGALTVRSISTQQATIGALSLGSTGSQTAALSLNGNGKTVLVGVDSSGNLTLGPVAITGSLAASQNMSIAGSATIANTLTVQGATGVVASNLQAPNGPNTSVPGALNLLGTSITLNGNVTSNGDITLPNGHDLFLSSTNGSASHIGAGADTDVAGSVTIPVSGGIGTYSYHFTQAYTTTPIVVVTPTMDPAFGSAATPRIWVTADGTAGAWTGFTIHYNSTPIATAGNLPFNYHVIGS